MALVQFVLKYQSHPSYQGNANVVQVSERYFLLVQKTNCGLQKECRDGSNSREEFSQRVERRYEVFYD